MNAYSQACAFYRDLSVFMKTEVEAAVIFWVYHHGTNSLFYYIFRGKQNFCYVKNGAFWRILYFLLDILSSLW